MCCEGGVRCGIWNCWYNTATRCTPRKMGKCCLILHVPAAPSSSSAKQKTTTLGGTEPHHSSWQYMELHRCGCHEPLAPLAMGDSGTSTVLTRYESMRLRSLHQSERTTARDPVQDKRLTYQCYRAFNMQHQQKWTHWWCTTPSKHLAKGDKKEGDYIEGTVHKCCTPVNKAMSEILNCCAITYLTLV